MAKSPAHQFGQEIGILLEEIIKPLLANFAQTRGFHLDTKGPRGRAREGSKVTWTDRYGNAHDLDFVIERDGSRDVRGRPLAFIESAWRRYTKHSRNKAQEIQGSILPVAEHYAWDAPFKGVILAGVFTKASIAQLESNGFTILYCGDDSMVRAFADVGIDIRFDEDTPDAAFGRALRSLKRLSTTQRNTLKSALVTHNQEKIGSFMQRLATTLSRAVESISVLPLYGTSFDFTAPAQAVEFLRKAPATKPVPAAVPTKIEVIIRFSDGTRIDGSFIEAERAIDFILYATKA